MKKTSFLLRVVAAVLALMLLTACGGAGSDSSANDASSKVSSNRTPNTSSVEQLPPDFNYNNPTEYEVYPGTRDPWLWPFSRNSIWNMPIGSNAEFVDANLKMPGHYGIDKENHFKTTESDPKLEVVLFKDGRWSDNENDIASRSGKYTYFPANTLIPETNGNECTAILQPDGYTLVQLQPACYGTLGATVINGHGRYGIDLYSNGIHGTHWGSGLSSFGGTIRKGELTGDQPIRHALKLNLWAMQYYYYGASYEGMHNLGYVWPADRHDGYATQDNGYKGTNKHLMIGGLLAIPGDVKMEELGIQTEVAKKMFYALQNYGCYLADDSYWDTFDWSAEAGVVEEVSQKYQISLTGDVGKESTAIQKQFSADMEKIITSLKVVKNNGPSSIGGGGTPRVPLAPNLPLKNK